MQKDLDAYLVHYNTKRPHQGRMINGGSPAEMFVKDLSKVKKQAEEPMPLAA